MQLCKITINIGNHQIIAFHSKSLDIFCTEIFVHIIIGGGGVFLAFVAAVVIVNNNFPVVYLGCL